MAEALFTDSIDAEVFTTLLVILQCWTTPTCCEFGARGKVMLIKNQRSKIVLSFVMAICLFDYETFLGSAPMEFSDYIAQ